MREGEKVRALGARARERLRSGAERLVMVDCIELSEVERSE